MGEPVEGPYATQLAMKLSRCLTDSVLSANFGNQQSMPVSITYSTVHTFTDPWGLIGEIIRHVENCK